MNGNLMEIIDKIHKGNIVTLDEFNEQIINEIIHLTDISVFHLLLNYIEKLSSNLSSEIMHKRKSNYQKLMETYNKETGLFERDNQIIDDIVKYIDFYNYSNSYGPNKLEDISKKYTSLFSNYEEIKDMIIYRIDSHKTYSQILKELKGEFKLTDSQIPTIQNLYTDILEYYETDSKLYEEEMQKRSLLMTKINDNYPDNVREIINKYIPKGNLSELPALIREQNANLLRNMLISNFFEDVPENFVKNLLNVVNFQLEIEQNFIDKDMLIVLQKVIDLLDETDVNVIYKVYKEMESKPYNYPSMFYDIFTKARIVNAEILMNAILKVEDANLNKTTYDNVECYLLEGEPFYMMVHSSTKKISNFQTESHDGISMSFISNDRLNVYSDKVIYGFTNLDPNQFVELYVKDSATEYNIGDEDKSLINTVPEFHNPNKFIKKTPKNSINEILYLAGKKDSIYPNIEPPKPSYIVCYDTINEESLESAKELNIPIVIINTKKYAEIEKNSHGNFGFLTDQDTYRSL